MPTEPAAASPAPHLEDAEVERIAAWTRRVRTEIARVIVGQEEVVERLLIGLLTGGHILLEGLPGLAKTLAATTLAQTLRLEFSRIQFTPDLLPADIVGSMIYRAADASFQARTGPIFANIALADEINRAPAKVQSALLEAMQERQVTLGDETLPLPDPFLVIATQNPLDHEGVYRLPEAQQDRFLLKVIVGRPNRDEERTILDRHARTARPAPAAAVADSGDIAAARAALERVHMEPVLRDYIVDIVRATRGDAAGEAGERSPLHGLVRCGASPRAAIALALAARARALLRERNFVSPADIKALAPDALRHRILLDYEAEAEGMTTDDALARALDAVPAP